MGIGYARVGSHAGGVGARGASFMRSALWGGRRRARPLHPGAIGPIEERPGPSRRPDHLAAYPKDQPPRPAVARARPCEAGANQPRPHLPDPPGGQQALPGRRLRRPGMNPPSLCLLHSARRANTSNCHMPSPGPLPCRIRHQGPRSSSRRSSRPASGRSSAGSPRSALTARDQRHARAYTCSSVPPGPAPRTWFGVKSQSALWIHGRSRPCNDSPGRRLQASPSASPRLERVEAYIAGLKEHHKHQSFADELAELLRHYGLECDGGSAEMNVRPPSGRAEEKWLDRPCSGRWARPATVGLRAGRRRGMGLFQGRRDAAPGNVRPPAGRGWKTWLGGPAFRGRKTPPRQRPALGPGQRRCGRPGIRAPIGFRPWATRPARATP